MVSEEELRVAPARPVAPVGDAGTWAQVWALLQYMTKTEVHTYAFSVAAQVILSLFPFIVLLLTLSEKVFHSERMADVVSAMMSNFLPNDQEFVMRNMRALAHSHAGTRLLSMVMLLITTTGVFLPLEVALNSVWGVRKNRSYLRNQILSLLLAASVGVLAMLSVGLTAAQQKFMEIIFFGHTDNLFAKLLGRAFLEVCATGAGIGLFFSIYWLLPNRKIPAHAVFAYSRCDRLAVGGGEISLHGCAPDARFQVRLRTVSSVGRADDVGVSVRTSAACGGTRFGDAARFARGAGG